MNYLENLVFTTNGPGDNFATDSFMWVVNVIFFTHGHTGFLHKTPLYNLPFIFIHKPLEDKGFCMLSAAL